MMFDGLDLRDAVQFCMERHKTQNGPDWMFLVRLASQSTPMNVAQRSRLLGMVRRARQGDLRMDNERTER